MTILQRLLRYLHSAVFDKAAYGELVLRLRHEHWLRWAVSDDVLKVTIPKPAAEILSLTDGNVFVLSDGSPMQLEPDPPLPEYVGEIVDEQAGQVTLAYQLTDLTVGQLIATLAADGMDVTAGSAEFSGLSAAVLVPGSGDQAESNGDHLYGFTNLLWSFLTGFARELRAAKVQIGEALKQMVIPTSAGEWLDLWGRLYGVNRSTPSETDEDYAPRIPKEAFRIRVNKFAIEKAIFEATGKDVRLEEPWGSMFRLSVSALSGEDAFYDGSNIGYHLLQPVSSRPIDWTDVLEVIARNRAAGIVILPPETRIGIFVDATVDGTIYSGMMAIASSSLSMLDGNRLNYMKLSDEVLSRNYSSITSEMGFYAEVFECPEQIYSAHRELSGFTWGEIGGWIEYPYGVTEDDLAPLFEAIEGFSDYVNDDLPDDMGA